MKFNVKISSDFSEEDEIRIKPSVLGRLTLELTFANDTTNKVYFHSQGKNKNYFTRKYSERFEKPLKMVTAN